MKPPNEVYQKAALFKQLWERKYPGEVFVIVGGEKGMVFAWAKQLVGIPDDLIVERFGVFAADEWYGENTRHSLPSFVKNFNSFVSKVRRKDGTWRRTEPMPIKEVEAIFQPFVDRMSSEKKATDPNEQFRCKKCHKIHSPNVECQ